MWIQNTNLPKKSETTCSEHIQMKEVATLRKIKFEIIEIKSLLEVSRILTSNRTLNRKLSNTWPWKRGPTTHSLCVLKSRHLDCRVNPNPNPSPNQNWPIKNWVKLDPSSSSVTFGPTDRSLQLFYSLDILHAHAFLDVDIGMSTSGCGCRSGCMRTQICMCAQIFWVFVPELSPRIHYFFALLWGYLLIILSWMNELTQNK